VGTGRWLPNLRREDGDSIIRRNIYVYVPD